MSTESVPGGPTTLLSTERRRDILNSEISGYASKGFRVASQSDTTAQLIKPKQFSFVIALLCFIFGFGFGLIIYIFWYLASRDKAVFVEVNSEGKVSARKG